MQLGLIHDLTYQGLTMETARLIKKPASSERCLTILLLQLCANEPASNVYPGTALRSSLPLKHE